jgi:hypothetical protein
VCAPHQRPVDGEQVVAVGGAVAGKREARRQCGLNFELGEPALPWLSSGGSLVPDHQRGARA